MKLKELDNIARGGETEQVEFKESPADSDAICRTICAFANDLSAKETPGYIVVGLKDDGSPSRIQVTDTTVKNLASLPNDRNISPPLNVGVDKSVYRGEEIAVVTVRPSALVPIRYKGVCYVRAGASNRKAASDDELRLLERRRSLPFDAMVNPDANADDLLIDKFQQYLRSAASVEMLQMNGRTPDQQMEALRFLRRKSSENSEKKPINAALLLFSEDSLRWFPGAYIQYLRIAGNQLTDGIEDKAEMAGTLDEQIRKAEAKLEANIRTELRMDDAIDEKRPEYPMSALRELTRNAVIHRRYEETNAPVKIYHFNDRIEFNNPGGPHGAVTVANFGKPGVTDYRNPLIANALRNLGFVQKFGMGFEIVRQKLETNGNPPIEPKPMENFIMLTVKKR